MLILNNFTIRQNYYFKKEVTRNEICFQNCINFTKHPKQTKILILQFAKSIAVGHSSEKTKID